MTSQHRRKWYEACSRVASDISNEVPDAYRSRTFSGIIGDVKALPPRKALSLIHRKKGLGTQYARLYLSTGIDCGYGFQACAAEAFDHVHGDIRLEMSRGRVLDVGCAVGVTAGVLGLEGVTGFDLFKDLLETASRIDGLTGVRNRYVTADMTRPWPFRCSFDTVFCGLVCHHLKEQEHVVRFFTEANRVLRPGGRLVITLPSGSVATARQFGALCDALTGYGFSPDRETSGLILSTDSEHSIFWEFAMIAERSAGAGGGIFIDPEFGFHTMRTPVSRVTKAERARERLGSRRRIRHDRFSFLGMDDIMDGYGDRVLVVDTVAEIMRDIREAP